LTGGGLTLDAGALIAYERSDRRMALLLNEALEDGLPLVVPAGVVGQVWRDGQRQARLAQLLGSSYVEVEALGDDEARAAGQLCGATGTSDVIDASVVLCARRRRHSVLTSDPGDLRRLDTRLRLVAV
jgi:hypothetical protein